MSSIVNLRAARKVRAKTEAKTQAAENRARHGRTKAQKAADALSAEQTAKAVDRSRRERPEQS